MSLRKSNWLFHVHHRPHHHPHRHLNPHLHQTVVCRMFQYHNQPIHSRHKWSVRIDHDAEGRHRFRMNTIQYVTRVQAVPIKLTINVLIVHKSIMVIMQCATTLHRFISIRGKNIFVICAIRNIRGALHFENTLNVNMVFIQIKFQFIDRFLNQSTKQRNFFVNSQVIQFTLFFHSKMSSINIIMNIFIYRKYMQHLFFIFFFKRTTIYTGIFILILCNYVQTQFQGTYYCTPTLSIVCS